MRLVEALAECINPDVMGDGANPAIFLIRIRAPADQRPAPASNPRQTRQEGLRNLGDDMNSPRTERSDDRAVLFANISTHFAYSIGPIRALSIGSPEVMAPMTSFVSRLLTSAFAISSRTSFFTHSSSFKYSSFASLARMVTWGVVSPGFWVRWVSKCGLIREV